MNNSGDSAIPTEIVREHVARLADLMAEGDHSAVILFHPSNMLAFAGTPHASSDRLTCAAVTREGQVHLVCPAFERPAVAAAETLAAVHTWQETENPYEVFAGALRRAGVRRGVVGVDGRMWLEAWRGFQAAFEGITLRPVELMLREVRICKSPAEQALLRAAHARGEQVFLALRDMLRAGVTERRLHKEAQTRMQILGVAVDPMIQSGPNGAIPHNPTGERALAPGDNVVVDSVITLHGYINDLTRTYAVGEPSPRARAAYRAVREAQAAAIAAARPGVECGALDRTAREIIEQAGFGPYFTHRLGHGIGVEGHEPPYLHGTNAERLRPGMAMTIEPGVYVPGEFGVRIEDCILISETGCEVIRGALPTDVSEAFEDGMQSESRIENGE